MDFDDSYLEEWQWFRPPQQVPSCLSFHLKMIEFNFQGLKGAFEVLKYFLKKAKVLEKLILHCYLPEKEKLKANTELLMLPRGSKKCQAML